MIMIPRLAKLLIAGFVATATAGCVSEYGRYDSAYYGGPGTGRSNGVAFGELVGGSGGVIIGDTVVRDRRYERRYNRSYRSRNCLASDRFGNSYRVAC
jgi:hypothetical protein